MDDETALAQAFAAFGATLLAPGESLSARGADGDVVVALWRHKFVGRDGALRYEQGPQPSTSTIRALIADLVHARDHLDGKLRAVLCVAKDAGADPRALRECAPYPHVLTLEALDESSGAFTLSRPLKPVA
jgi:hypothetical protein